MGYNINQKNLLELEFQRQNRSKNHGNDDEIKNYKTLKQRIEFIRKYVKRINVDWDNNNNTHTLTIIFNIKIVFKIGRLKNETWVDALSRI